MGFTADNPHCFLVFLSLDSGPIEAVATSRAYSKQSWGGCLDRRSRDTSEITSNDLKLPNHQSAGTVEGGGRWRQGVGDLKEKKMKEEKLKRKAMGGH